MAFKSDNKPDFKSRRTPRHSEGAATAGPSTAKKHDEPRAAPSFVSTLKDEETDFPRGGGTSLTALEVKQTRAEGRREAEAETTTTKQGLKRRRQISEREAKRAKKNEVHDKSKERDERDKDTIRVEELNYKRLTPGTKLLTRVHTVLPLHLILSLPNNLLAHVPITEISTTLTALLQKEEESDEESDAGSDDEESGAPDLATLFTPGMYFPAKVLNLYPTASQSFFSQYPVSETTRLAARVEMSLVPEKVNDEVVKADLEAGFGLTGEVLSEEDKGYRVGLGLSSEVGGEGWVSLEEAKSAPGGKLVPGQLLPCVIASSTAGGRIYQLSIEQDKIVKSQLNEISNVASILPGHLVSVLVTAVVPSGLNVKIGGFFDGTIDIAHLALGGEDIDDKYKVGKKIRARIIYDSLATTPRRFGLSVAPHILALNSPLAPDGQTPMESAITIGQLLTSVKITRVIQEWGAICRTDDGLEGFVHISHISDERIPALSGSTGPFRVGTLHRARVIGHSPLDGILLLSFEQKVLEQVFMQVDELQVGQQLKGTIHRLSDKGLFININGSVHGVVWPSHYADIRLKHPEKRFKIGSSVKARVFALEPARSRVVLTLKKTLVDSELDVPADFTQVTSGMITPAVVSKILDKGCLVDLFGGLRAFIPQSEASQNFIVNLSDIFFVGKPVNVRITEVNQDTQKIVASVRQALPTALAAAALEVSDEVSGIVSQIHADQVALTLIPSQITALLSLSNLSNHRHIGIEELRSSLKVGERLDELIVVSKNAQTGLVILANKRTAPTKKVEVPAPVKTGISGGAKSWDSIKVGQKVSGTVINHASQGTMVQLSAQIRGRVHPTDASDDFSIIAGGEGPLNVGEKVECYVLRSNPATRIIDLSTRASRVQGEGDVIDPEVEGIKDVQPGMKIRGLVKNVASHGVFVALGRNLTARVMIKELFDEFVKDWQSRFEVNQLVSGKILSVDEKRKTVEMTLRTLPSGSGSKKAAKKPISEFTEGQVVDAIVKKVEPYGIFLRINGSDVSGLCHKSQISDSKTHNVEKALAGFRAGDSVRAVVTDVDEEKGRLNFTIKPSAFGETVEDEDMSGDEEEAAEEDDEEEEGDVDAGEEDDEDMEDDENDVDEDEEEESGDELDIEDGDEDDDEDDNENEEDEDEDVEIDIETPAAPQTSKKAKAKASVPTLTVSGGFDWTGDASAVNGDDDDESSDEDEEELSKPKSKGKQKATDLTATAPSAQPSSTSEFERALLSSPNSSFLWIQYMSFLLTLHEVDKARSIGRKAVEKIGYREEEEKLNVWMALVNLEIGFGTEQTREKVFKEASQYNDARTVYTRYADALLAAGKDSAAEEIWTKTVKKFSAHTEAWTKAAEYWFRKGDVEAARDLLPRSMKSLDKTKHVETIEKFAVMEFRHADAERGKTLFEELLDRYPKRLDLVSVYIDQLARVPDVQAIRSLVDRTLAKKLTAKKAKFLFKKLLAIEGKIGDAQGEEKAKEKAREWVMANAAKDE